MLTDIRIRDTHTRRDFLRIGGLAFGGLTLPQLLQLRASEGKPFVKDRSVVFLHLMGGPPQVDTFDPKPDATAEIQPVGGTVQTSLPGVRFAGHFPKMAAMADRMAVVRSFSAVKGGPSHEAGYTSVLTAGHSSNAVMGSMYARLAGALHPKTNLPNNVLILPEAIDSTLKLGRPSGAFTFDQTMGYFANAGSVGPAYKPFNPGGGGNLIDNLTLNMPRERFDDRRLLLGQLDQFRKQLDTTKAFDGADSFQTQAADVLVQGIAKAFDFAKEDPKTLAKYDTSHLLDMKEIHKGGKKFWPNFSRSTNLLGKQMMLARRLCEAGCGFVTVIDSCWDFHDDGNNPPAAVGIPTLAPQLDHAVTAFLDDLRERGLEDKILLVITSEMGRTPAKKGGKSNGGSGHWGDLTSLILAGGGLKTGQVVGRSDAKGAFPATERYTPTNLLATIFHSLFDMGELRLQQNMPRDLIKLTEDAMPIRELV